MRVGFVLSAAVATLLASANAGSVSAGSVTKKKYTIMNPDNTEMLDAVYVKDGDEKYLILHLNKDDKDLSEDTASDKKEERGGGVGAGTAVKLKKQFTGEYNTFWNKLLWHIFHKLTPSKNRIG